MEYREHPSLVGSFRNGEFVAFPPAQDADVTVWAGWDEDGEPFWEGLLATRLSPTSARLCAIPVFAYDLNLDDEVELMSSAEGPLVVAGVLQDAGNFTFRVWLGEHAPPGGAKQLMKDLERFDCWFDVYSERLLAISCGPDEAQHLADHLKIREDRGDFRYETGRMSAP